MVASMRSRLTLTTTAGPAHSSSEATMLAVLPLREGPITATLPRSPWRARTARDRALSGASVASSVPTSAPLTTDRKSVV